MKLQLSRAAVALSLLVGCAGCALTSKADVVDVRYFSPERVKPHLTSAEASSARDGSPELRLGRVSSGSNLRDRIAYRGAAYELGYYETWRWSERPETYVRRDLARKLFEEHGLRRVYGGAAPTLDVELIAFDDLRLPEQRAARVQLAVVLSSDEGVLWEETLTVDEAVSAKRPTIEDVVAAMATALDEASERISRKVQSALEVRSPPR